MTAGRWATIVCRQIARNQRGTSDDLRQEIWLTLLEMGIDWDAEIDPQTKTRINQLLSRYASSLGSRALSLNGPAAERAKDLREAVPLVPLWRSRGPRKAPKDRQARLRHKRIRLGVCVRCGRTLPDREHTRCHRCRVQEHAYYLRSKRGRPCKRRYRTKYSEAEALT